MRLTVLFIPVRYTYKSPPQLTNLRTADPTYALDSFHDDFYYFILWNVSEFLSVIYCTTSYPALRASGLHHIHRVAVIPTGGREHLQVISLHGEDFPSIL